MANQDLEGGRLKVQNNYRQGASAPYYHENTERQWTSWLIPMFVVANIVMFIITMSVNDCPGKKNKSSIQGKCVATFLGRFSFQPLSENPLLGPSSLTLSNIGALERSKVVDDNQKWRLVTCIWLHAGVIHIIANMLSLVFIGIRLEQQFGFVRIGIIYLLSGFSGSILSALFINNRISAGASGALFGLLGSMLAEIITNWTIYSNKAAALFSLLFIIAINLAIGLLPHVDNFAHIGGFFTGLLLGFILLMRPQFGWIHRHNLPPEDRANSKYLVYQYILFLVALVLLLAGFIIGLVILFRGQSGYKHCRWCHHLSCIPTSRWKCDL